MSLKPEMCYIATPAQGEIKPGTWIMRKDTGVLFCINTEAEAKEVMQTLQMYPNQQHMNMILVELRPKDEYLRVMNNQIRGIK